MDLKKIDREFISKLGSVLKKSGYTEDAFNRVGLSPVSRYSPRYKFILNKRLATWGIDQEIISLFFFGDKVDVKSLGKFFPKPILGQFFKSGILKNVKGLIHSQIKIIPYKGFYFASDFVTKYEDSNQKNMDLVYPVSQDSADLVEAALKTRAGKTLDPTTGCGVHAIIQSKTSAHVVGVDINPRAIEFAKLNAAMNKVKNAEFFVGNLYEPVEDMKFDLVLSNPPYETSAQTKLVMGNGGETGRNALGEIIEKLPIYLKEKGVCQIVAKLFLKEGETVGSVMKKYLDGENYTVLYQDINSSDVLEDAYSRYNNIENFDKYSHRVDELLNRYKKTGISKVSYGVISLKKAKRFSYKERAYSNIFPLPLTPSDVVRDYFKLGKSL